MRKLFCLFLVALTWSLLAISAEIEQVGIGQEYIEPLRYPKFSFWFEYGMMRRFQDLGNSKLQADLPHNLGTAFSCEAGLYKYLNAGALFSLNLPTKKENFEPINFRFALFAKPYWPITEHISIFSRLGGGLSVSFFNFVSTLRRNTKAAVSREFKEEMSRTYGLQNYSLLPFGFNAMATVGVEVFPFSRIGLALEWGFRGDIFFASKGSILDRENPPGTPSIDPKSSGPLKYLVYETPLMLSLNVIL